MNKVDSIRTYEQCIQRDRNPKKEQKKNARDKNTIKEMKVSLKDLLADQTCVREESLSLRIYQ